MDKAAQEREVDVNYDVFVTMLPDLMRHHADEHALMRGGQVVGFYRSTSTALAAGGSRFEDGIYSVQEVTDRPIDLGFYSHAVYPGIA